MVVASEFGRHAAQHPAVFCILVKCRPQADQIAYCKEYDEDEERGETNTIRETTAFGRWWRRR